MRASLCGLGLVWALLWAAPVHAQFANHSVGGFVGYMKLNDAAQINFGFPLGLSASVYIDAGFELVARVAGMLLVERITGSQILGGVVSTGFRYLFLQERLRPYAGLDLVGLYVAYEADVASRLGTTAYVGAGPNAGVEYFFWDNVSLGTRAQVNLYWWLNQPLQTSLSVTFEGTAYF
jgi:outer membrane protein